MTSSPPDFDYDRFNVAQVSRSTLMEGFRITDQQWLDIYSVVTRELTKRGLTPELTLRGRFARQVVDAVRHKILRAFPELLFHVPPEWLDKGTYQIIRVIHTTRKKADSATDTTKFDTGQIPVSSMIVAPDPTTPSFDIKSDRGSPAVSSKPAAQATSSLAPPGGVPAFPSKICDSPYGTYLGTLPTNTSTTQVDVTGASSAQSPVHGQNGVQDSRSSPDGPNLMLLAAPPPHITIHEDLRKIQLHAARLNYPKDSSFINLGELLCRNDNREGLRDISYSSLEDLSDQDWQYWYGTILGNDLDTGFDPGSDKIYYNNGGGEMIRVKNAHNWRAAMVAMRTAGLTHFKFYIEQPVQRESTIDRLLMSVSSALTDGG